MARAEGPGYGGRTGNLRLARGGAGGLLGGSYGG